MIFCSTNKFITRFRYEYILIFSLIWLFLFAGCSSLYSKNKKSGNLTIKNSDLAKKIGIAIFENKTSFKDRSYEKVFQEYLIESITDSCSDILLVKPGDAGYPDFLVELPTNETGSIDNLGLAQLGRQSGMNAIVTGEIMGITGKEEKRGIIFFKDLRQFIYFQVKIEVYATGTGVKLVDERYSEEIEIDELELELFKGYITSVTENNIIISSGKKVGLVPGAVFEVFTTGEIIEGVDGHRFRTPGRKIGEVKLTAVYADSCKADFYTGSDIMEGCSVKTKK